MTATSTAPQPDLSAAELDRKLAAGKRRRQRNETLMALFLVAPATIVTFLFGVWPVVFGFYVSLHQWRASTSNFLGLDQYVRALGNAAYVLAFSLCLLFLYGSYRALRGMLRAMQDGQRAFYPYLLPGGLLAFGTIGTAIGFVTQNFGLVLPGAVLLLAGAGVQRWAARQYPTGLANQYSIGSWQVILLIVLAVGLFTFTVSELIGDTDVPLQIVLEMAEDASFPPLAQQLAAGAGVVLAGIGLFFLRWLKRQFDDEYVHARQRSLIQLGIVVLGVVLFALATYLLTVLQLDVQAAGEVQDLHRNDVLAVGMEMTGLERNEFRSLYGTMDGGNLQEMLLAWPQIVAVFLGGFLLVMAYRVWQAASKAETGIGTGTLVMLAIIVAFAGWLLLGELPQALAVGDTDYYQALLITTTYSIGTVPVQLALGLLLAYIMFYEINIGKSLYRMVYFMPYIAPTVATATVFGIIFSSRQYSLANQGFGLLGLPPLDWLLESEGVFQVLAEIIFGAGTELPDFLAGPSLALVSIILYNIWVFAGYNAVIFLAGLGAIPHELYEAAKVDGAGRWASFRKITFPLLSPTTFFLTVLSISGTFRAFSHIYVLRRDAARGTSDTASVHIFVQFWQFNQWGYASAMAFILFGIIVILTLVQNEVSKERVFYG